MELLKNQYEFYPICATCGNGSFFEFNEDMSYIKCTNCGREYLGGKEELFVANQEQFEYVKNKVEKELQDKMEKELNKSIK